MELTWNNTSLEYILKQQEVHLWKVGLNCQDKSIEGLLNTLSVDEIAKAERFYQKKHRQGFIIARGLLRVILGRYLALKPSSLIFRYSAKGKPSLAKTSLKLSFNLSHSENLVIYAVSLQEIGVDLEYKKTIKDLENLAKRFFSPREYEEIQNSRHDQEQLFFRLWTAKEAYLKATGEGIAGGLEKAEVTIGEDGQLSLASPWSLYSFMPEENYYAALASREFIEKITAFSIGEDVAQFCRELDHNPQDERDDKIKSF